MGSSDKEFIQRTAFSLIAVLTVHEKNESDDYFRKYDSILVEGSCDNRNFVKKSVNWAIRQIGKRNLNLNKKWLIYQMVY